MPNFLHGEYIYDGHFLQSADSNISQGHEEIIINGICGEYAEDLVRDAEKLNNPELKNIINKVKKWINMGEYDYNDVYDLYDSIRYIDQDLVSDPKLKEAMAALKGDARKYGCKYLGYIIIRMNNFEVWELNQETAKKIVNAVHEIIDEVDLERDVIEDEDILQQEIEVNSYKTDVSRTYTVEELKNGQLFKTPTAPKTKANVFIPKPSGTRAWQQMYTSESFSFKEWFILNENNQK